MENLIGNCLLTAIGFGEIILLMFVITVLVGLALVIRYIYKGPSDKTGK